MLEGLDFVSPIYDPTTFEVIGEGPGVECHSSPMQPDCPTVFGGFGLDITDGSADPAADAEAIIRQMNLEANLTKALADPSSVTTTTVPGTASTTPAG